MSGLVDCMIVIATDAAKAIGMGVQDAAFMAKMAATNTVDMSKDFFNGFINGIGDTVTALQNLAKEEKSLYREALTKYNESLIGDSIKTKNYISKIVSDSRFMEFEFNEEVRNRLTNNAKIDEINEIFMFANFYSRCKDALVEFSTFDDVEEELLTLREMKKSFIEFVKNSEYSKTISLNEKIKSMCGSLKERMNEFFENNNQYKVERMNEVFVNLSFDISEVTVLMFNNELSELLNNSKEETAIAIKNRLFELKKNMIEYASKMNYLEYIDGINECQTMVEYVYDTLNDETISDELKLERVELRVNALKDDYLKCEKQNKLAFELKEKYDEALWRNISYKKYLKQEAGTLPFNPKTAKEEISRLEKENDKLYEKCLAKQKNEYVRKVLKEAMLENQLEYLESKESDNGRFHIDQDIYHIENGNVVSVTVSETGAINYYVNKVEIDGIRNDKEDTVKSMHTFCSKFQNIQKTLKEHGIELDEKRRLEPNESLVHTIEVKEESKTSIRNKIKKANSIKGKDSIRKHVGE